MALARKDLLPDEEVLLSKFANLWVRPSEYGLSEFAFGGSGDNEALGGRAYLTNYRVVFAAHSLNRLTGMHSIFLPNIRDVKKGWTSLQIATETQEYGFVMWFNRRFYETVEEKRQAFGRKEIRRLQSLVRDNLDNLTTGLQVNEVADAVNSYFLGLQQPFSALKDALLALPPGEQSSVLEVVSLLKQGQKKESK
jgi:hypothetical protein